MDSILKRIKTLSGISAAEKSIADYIEGGYPASIIESISQVSAGAGVSPSSVTRFVRRLGYSGFSDLREEANRAVESRLTSPIERYSSKDKQAYGYKEHLAVCVKNITETSFRLSPADMEKAAGKISEAANLYVTGGASAAALAGYFAVFVRYMRENVHVIPPDISTLAHRLADVSENDVLLAVAHYRVSNVTASIAKYFKDKGCFVILVSDRSVNPATPYADINLTVCSGGTPMFSSRVATLALLESLFNMLIPLNEEKIKKRFDIMEKIFSDYNVYAK